MTEYFKLFHSNDSSRMELPRGFYFLVGPTAVGKSSVAQHIAGILDCPVISADSMLVYRGMDVGTAKPSMADREKVSYFGIDIADPDRSFSVWEYIEYIRSVFDQLDGAIVAGGTGLYVKSLLSGLADLPGSDIELRKKWSEIVQANGISSLQQVLHEKYPDVYDAIADKQNLRRLLRALEIAEGSTEDMLPKNTLQCSQDRSVESSGNRTIVGLRMPMGSLYARIAARVNDMYDCGLVKEVEALISKYPAISDTARQAIGYAEVMSFFDGSLDINQAKEKTVLRTRHLAKRQMTWFRHQADVKWIDIQDGMTLSQIADQVMMYWMELGPSRLNL